jgi:hypothetical protein
MKKQILTLAFLAAITLSSPSLSQGAVLMTEGTAVAVAANANYTVGTQFTVGTSDLSVTSLGIWDESQDGLAVSHDVGLWNSGGTLLGSVTVPSGTGGSLVGSFRYIALGLPVTLTAGQSYTLGATYALNSADKYRPNSSTPVFSSDVSSPASRWVTSATLARPTSTASGFAYVGPNLQYSVIPEPTTWALLAAGLMTVMVLRRRRNS